MRILLAKMYKQPLERLGDCDYVFSEEEKRLKMILFNYKYL